MKFSIYLNRPVLVMIMYDIVPGRFYSFIYLFIYFLFLVYFSFLFCNFVSKVMMRLNRVTDVYVKLNPNYFGPLTLLFGAFFKVVI